MFILDTASLAIILKLFIFKIGEISCLEGVHS
jgi:hypothetical protein